MQQTEENKRLHIKFWSQIFNRTDHFGGLGINGRSISNLIFKKFGMEALNEFNCRFQQQVILYMVTNVWVLKNQEICALLDNHKHF